ncbi:MAG TPA: DUF1080 domain-containing protein [Bryobacteraceae bacterium]|nr:DUF1080 domain-containing protein [Bryobacteraceae bacterium]
MKSPSLWIALALAPFACHAQSGWVSLFDGRTMAGWDDPRQKTPPGDAWTIDDGCLKANRAPHITEDLFSKDTFRDFELSWEWKIAPGANSGVKYRIQDHVFLARYAAHGFEDQVNYSLLNRPAARPDRGQDYVVGFEYQLLDNAGNSDARAGVSHQAGALYDIVGPEKDVTKPVGEFNESRLVVKGNHVAHWLNGVKVVDTELDSPLAAARIAHRWGNGTPVTDALTNQPHKNCHISLQNHGGDTWFRNIKVRRLE